MPSGKGSTQEEPITIGTIAAHTVEAQLTMAATSAGVVDHIGDSQDEQETHLPTLTPTWTATLVPTETQPPPPTKTPIPQATATSIPCDRIEFVKDVTIPDKTKMTPGEKFMKTWRLKNTGTCTWTSGYSLVFDSGDAMEAPAASQLTTGTIPQGDEFDVSIELVAPDSAGTYRGNFKLRNTDGKVFGLGDKSKPFWVEIVVEEASGLMFDFITFAEIAEWGSGTDTISHTLPGEIALVYGSLSNPDGYVIPQNSIVLEDGSKSGVVLETHPKMVYDGYIIGRYPKYTVGAGDYIKARLGFRAEGNGSCGAGEVVFQIMYSLDNDLDNVTELGSWSEKCDGNLRRINVGLESLKGKTVRFYLVVFSSGDSTDDIAIWDSIGVMR
jgi:hypothetical protein